MTHSIFFHHNGIGEQRISIDITEENFVTEIAPARTFGFLKDIEYLRSNGLAKGGSLDNAVDNGRKRCHQCIGTQVQGRVCAS